MAFEFELELPLFCRRPSLHLRCTSPPPPPSCLPTSSFSLCSSGEEERECPNGPEGDPRLPLPRRSSRPADAYCCPCPLLSSPLHLRASLSLIPLGPPAANRSSSSAGPRKPWGGPGWEGRAAGAPLYSGGCCPAAGASGGCTGPWGGEAPASS